MSWQSEWKAITARMDALMMIGERLDTYPQQFNPHLNYLAGGLAGQANQLKTNLKTFYDKYHSSIPSAARLVFQNYFGVSNGHSFEHNTGAIPQISATNSPLSSLFLLISEVNFCLTDTSEIIKRQSERAFLHLQQSIVVAEDIRLRWQKAFDDGEVACEKLGAAHLLQHGIYAFKASAKAENARKQAALYHTGILSGIELVNYRYIVLVSENQMDGIADVDEKGIFYRHINISVSPLSPSKASLL